MTELIWLNGAVLPLKDATVSVEDRGFQFADGVYEVIRLYNARPYALDPHLDRLDASARGIALQTPLAREKLKAQITSLIAQSGVGEGMIYLQLTRGTAPRNHPFPDVQPTLLFYVRSLEPLPPIDRVVPVKLLTQPDERWKRCWIKTIALLPNVLAKNAALAAGADEAVFVDDGVVTECSVSNFFAIIDGRLVTHPVGPKVLPGITRSAIIQCAHEVGVAVEERPLPLAQAQRAQELFITSTTREISPVSQWDGQNVGTGQYPVTRRIHEALRKAVSRDLTKI